MYVKIKCGHCGGSTPFDTTREFGFCTLCGASVKRPDPQQEQTSEPTRPATYSMAYPYAQPMQTGYPQPAAGVYGNAYAPVDHTQRINELIEQARTLETHGNIDSAIDKYNQVLNLNCNMREAQEQVFRLSHIITEPNIFVRRVPYDVSDIGRLPITLYGQGYTFPQRMLARGEFVQFTAPVGAYKLTMGRTGPSIIIEDRFTRVRYVCEVNGHKVKANRE